MQNSEIAIHASAKRTPCAVPPGRGDVSYWGQSGKHRLFMSISGYDP